MGLFDSRRPNPPPPPTSQVPLAQVDLSKRYDVYCTDVDHDRLYENVRFVGLRTFSRITEYSHGVGDYLEMESVEGSRWMIPSYGIRLICEHGVQPAFKVLRRRRNRE